MYYKIQKSLGNASAVLTASIPDTGICVELQQFDREDASIILYQDGLSKDLNMNGWRFPCVYNNIELYRIKDIYGGHAKHRISFVAVDPNGAAQKVTYRKIYGVKESLAVEYFISMLYNISCCNNLEQFSNLYKFIIDNEWFHCHQNRKEAVEVLYFIESFMPQLDMIEDKEFLSGLKQQLHEKSRIAQEIIANSH